MKKLELNLQKRIIIWEFPDKYEFKKDGEIIYFRNKYTGDIIEIPSKYKFICKVPGLTEDISKGLVETIENGYYKDYQNENNFFTLPSKSFISSIEALGWYWVESPMQIPHPEEFQDHFEASLYYDKYIEAESRTINHYKAIIFEILD